VLKKLIIFSVVAFQLLYFLLNFYILLANNFCGKQNLSYRKQIACQLGTQYVEGIYDNPVTFKSRYRSLKVTGNGTIG